MEAAHTRLFVLRWHRLLTIVLLFMLVVALFPAPRSRARGLTAPTLASNNPGSWFPTASMSARREWHTATLLMSGKVLVVGGQDVTTVHATAELYDPITNTWSPAGTMSLPRARHSATLLNDGRVLVVGGVITFDPPASTNSAEVYNPITNNWSPAGNLPAPGGPTVLLGNGKVLTVGGYDSNEPLPSSIYDPSTNSWSPAASLNIARNGPIPVTLLGNGKVLVAGGAEPDTGTTLNSAELYDPITNTWTPTGSMNNPRVTYPAVLLGNGKVFVVGAAGSSAELYNSTINTWSLTQNIGYIPGGGAAATLLGNGKVLVVGGLYNPDSSPFSRAASANAEVFDPPTATWTSAPNMATRRWGHTATLLGTGQVLVVGGAEYSAKCCQDTGLNTAELFTPTCSTKVGDPCDTQLYLTLDEPPEISVANGQYAPNPFTIAGIVRNVGGVTAKDVRATLYLPHGLAFAVGSATQLIGELMPAEERHVTWSVRGTGLSEASTLKYFVAASASNAVALPASRLITMPSLFTIAAITPDRGGNVGSVTVDILGSGFEDGVVVRLGNLIDRNTFVISTEHIQATFDLRGQLPGTAAIEVVHPSGQVTASSKQFTIVSGGQANATIELFAPQFVRNTKFHFYVIVRNSGLVNLDNTLLRIAAQAPSNTLNAFNTRKITGSAGLVTPMGIPSITQIDIGLGPNGQAILDQIIEPLESGCVNLLADFPCLKEMQKVQRISNDITQNEKEYTETLAEFHKNNCDQPSQSGAQICVDLYNELQQLSEERAQLGKDYVQAIQDLQDCIKKNKNKPEIPPPPPSYVTCRVASYDPNDIYGPTGFGDAHYIRGGSPVSYNIVFENKPEATAAAQEVVITNQLDVNKFDLSTLNLGPISFGNTQVEPPPGLRQFSTDVDLRPANNLIVRINAGLNEENGLITWRFTSLDPATGLPTADPLAGFLPPNKTSLEGEGNVFYTVTPKPGLATSTDIRNRATIVFDANQPIDTPEWLNTVDNTKPTSRVLPLANTQGAASFTVTWSATDSGAGVQDYTVYVSENGEPYTIWLLDTAATSETFVGQSGKTYAFYSIARDKVGNVEDPPMASDTATKIPYLRYLPTVSK